MKVRRGLGTSDDAVADEYVRQLNILLQDDRWWSAERRGDASQHFAEVVVSAFYDGIEVGSFSSLHIRDGAIPFPTKADGYSRILILGTTGAGKTSLVRHLIGTSSQERFPSTSTAKTTTADTEIITANGSFEAVVTFLPEHEVRAYIEECMEAACIEAVEAKGDEKIMSKFLQHEEQRFRLSYILGAWNPRSALNQNDFSFDDLDDTISDLDDLDAVPRTEQSDNLATLERLLVSIKKLVADVRLIVENEIGLLADQTDSDDRAAWLEIFGNEIYSSSLFADLSIDILEEVTRRFDLIKRGTIVTGQGGWPTSWSFNTADRTEFLGEVRWFSSNHHQQFGRLLTPIVDGIRVRGPFFPSDESLPGTERLIILDGEGLGHAANNASSISTRISQRFDSSDMILLVDNAQQPMQAAPLALLRTLGSSGFSNKVGVAFTHFDLVKGSNLVTFEQKREHVEASIKNAVSSLRDHVGLGIAGALDRQFERRSVFLGGLDRDTERLPQGFKRELSKLISMMAASVDAIDAPVCAPVYEFKGLEIAMRDAIDAFRAPWRARLGLGYHERIAKEHWTRIKALSRRLANGWDDEYGNLRPIADLLAALQEEASKWLDRPSDWTATPRDEDEREASLNPIRQTVFSKLQDLVIQRLKDDQSRNWRIAFNFSGKGSTSLRADVIDQINLEAAPHMSANMTEEARAFLNQLYSILQTSIESNSGRIRA